MLVCAGRRLVIVRLVGRACLCRLSASGSAACRQSLFVQAVGLPLGLLSGGSGGGTGGGCGGPYVTMLPPQQPPTPTSQHHTPHLITTYFRPGVSVARGQCHQRSVLQGSVLPESSVTRF